MPFDPTILALMTSEVTYEPFQMNDGYGDEAFGPTSQFPAHITYARKILRTDRDEEAVSTAQLQMPPPGFIWRRWTVPKVAIDDHMVLPDGIDRRVLSITVYTDGSSDPVNHQSVALT
jgi:hypothetical protein